MEYCKIIDDKNNIVYEIVERKGNNVTLKNKNVIVITRESSIKPALPPDKKEGSNAILLQDVTVDDEIMLRHMTEYEAIDALDSYISLAITHKKPRVRIVHGRNGHILKDAVHEYLKKSPYIKEYYISPYEKGSIGVTIAIFK